MAKSIQVAVQASLTNTKEIIAQIREALNNELASLDKKGLGFLDNISKKLNQATELFNQGSLNQARKLVQEINNSMYSVYRALRIEAGAASDDLDKLSAKLEELKKQKAIKDLQNPEQRYRKRKDNTVVYTKNGLTEEQIKKIGGSTERGVFKDGVPIPYGGKNSSMYGIANAIASRLRVEEQKTEGKDTDLINELKEALKSIGFEKTDTGVKFINLSEEYNKSLNEFQEQINQLTEAIRKAQQDFDEEEANVEHVKVAADGQTFDIAPLQARTSQNIKELDDALEEQNRVQKEAAAATKKKNDADEEAAIRQIDLKNAVKEETVAQTNQTSAVTKAVTTFFGYQMVIRQLRKLWREAIHTITELDKQLTNQAIVTDLTREQTWKLVTTYQDLADQAGVTQTEIAGVTTEYLRQGETLDNALVLTKAATAAATVAGISASDSVKYLTTAVHGFKLEAEDALAVSDKFAALAAQAATNYEDLAIALSKVASQAELAGMSMDYTLALLTTGLDVTQEAPESIGTALKTVIARMREISDYGKTLEDSTDLNQVEAGLKAVGIQLRNGIGELRSTEDVLDELGQKWKDLSANQQAAVAKALAGTRQQSRLVAIMENYDDVLKNMAVSQNSLGATTAQQVKYLQGMEAAMNRMQNAYQSLIETMVKSDTVIGFVNFISGVIKNIQKFLSKPAGQWALFTGIMSLMSRSQQFLEKIRGVMNQLLQILSETRKQQEAVVEARKKQLSIEEKELALRAGIGSDQLNKTSIGKTERSNGWLSNRSGESNLADLIFTYLNPRNWGSEGASRRQNTRDSWWNNNSLLAKWNERKADKQLQNDLLNNATNEANNYKKGFKITEKGPVEHLALNDKEIETLIKNEQELAQVRGEAKQASKAAVEAEEEYQHRFDTNSQLDDSEIEELEAKRTEAKKQEWDLLRKQEALEKSIADARAKGASSEAEVEKKIKILSNRRLSGEEKLAYLANKEKIAKNKIYTEEQLQLIREKKAKGEILDKAEAEVLKKAEVVEKAEAEVNAAELKAFGSQTGKKFSTAVSAATGIASAVSGMISMIQGMVETIQNRYKEVAENAIDKASEMQSEIYNNTQTRANLQTLSADLKKLDRQVIKSTDTIAQLNDVRKQLLTELEISEAEAKRYSNQQLYDKAMAKRVQLENKNNELLSKLGDTLLGAANNYDAGAGAVNILSKFAMGAGLGASATGWMAAGGVTAVGTAIGTAVGALIGGVVGIFEEISKKMASDDAKGKVKELLQSDEGVSQMQYYFKALYKSQIDETTAAGKQLGDSIKTTYASLIDSLSSADIEALLEQYNWNPQEMADKISGALASSGKAITDLTRDTANFQERVAAAEEIYAKLIQESPEVGKAFLQQYSMYIDLGESLGQYLHYMDDYKWSMVEMNELMSQLAEDGLTLEEARERIHALGAALEDGSISSEEMEEALSGMSHASREAAAALLSTFSMQDLADQFTTAKNNVNNIRDTQSKWNSMSLTERQRFIDDNEEFFNIEGAREAFYNGEDITKFIEQYKKEIQEGLLETVSDKLASTEVELYDLRKQFEEAEAANDQDLMEQLQTRIATTERSLKDLKDTYADVNGMFALTLSEVVKKQNDQIAKLKEMYQAEEKALTDSLNKRKEAYQKYFFDLQSQEAAADYALSRDQLIDSISRLGAGTDATSRNKVAELRKQLAQIEKEETKRKTEEARQAVLDNIDNQVKNIQESFEQLLGNNKDLLASMNDSTKLQYLQYLATLRLTDEDYQQRVAELSDLLDGTWTTSGRQNFNNVKVDAVQTPQSPTTQQDPQSVMNLTIGNQTEQVTLTQAKMKDLIQQMFTWLNSNAGTHFKV